MSDPEEFGTRLQEAFERGYADAAAQRATLSPEAERAAAAWWQQHGTSGPDYEALLWIGGAAALALLVLVAIVRR